MVDIHSHILAGVDDGPGTLEQSVAMVRLAAETGTTDIVATPHANLEFSYHPDVIDQKIAELQDASQHVIRIHRGCDFHLHYDNIQDALTNPRKYAINQKNYLLVEFSELLIVKTTDEVLDRLRIAGMAPIVTHPERNWLLQRRIEQLESWVSNGCYIQVTAQSLFGRFGRKAKRFCDELMKRGLVHFVASDAHDAKHRPPRLDEAYNYIAKKFGEMRAERLCVLNPQAVLAGDLIKAEEIEEPEKPRQWYKFWG
jgi:protein-tyrosine phosphatase